MQYFKDCKSTEEVKKLYRELANKFHPDKGGNNESMAELNKQYHSWKPSEFRKFSDWSNEKKEEMLKQGFKKYQQEYQSTYGGYGDYKYNTNANMRQEYYNQRDDPRLADYERMKADYHYMKLVYAGYANLEGLYLNLQHENEILKKKVQTQKRQLNKLKNMPKATKKKPLQAKNSKNYSSLDSIFL